MTMRLHFSGVALLAAGLAVCGAASAEDPAMRTESTAAASETATFGAGCFWCGEAVFQRLPGVRSVLPGYMGGRTKNPTYEQVCSGATGHAEVFRIEFDPARIAYDRLLDVFWRIHDPTSLNRQGADEGTQYRSAVFYHSDAQRRAAEASKAKLDAAGTLGKKIVTEIVPAGEFYPAEDYHRDYFNRNRNAPYCRYVILPKLRKLDLDKP
jgi:peptide-methionine (S)-S-oxide reductase